MQNKENLINKYLERTISSEERRALEKWVLNNSENASYFKERIQAHAIETEDMTFNSDSAFGVFLKKVETRKTSNLTIQSLLRYAAVFVGLLIGSYFIFQNLKVISPTNELIVQDEKDETRNNIVVTLADGSKKIISSPNDASITDKNGRVIANGTIGALSFTDVQEATDDKLIFNEVYIPFGDKLKIILSDKTEVWLNAGSTLKFPQNLSTSENDRIVYLDGEAFFDVTKNEAKPFIVKTDEIDIKVLGTQFNVSAYNQDEVITTTLVEGAVNVYQSIAPKSSLVLSPDDQASFTKENSSFSKKQVDTDMYTGWMQNRLIIDKLSFQQIMTKLERTHNVTIINKAPSLNNEVFNGEFKNENINDILNTISLSKHFTYEINQNIITITK